MKLLQLYSSARQQGSLSRQLVDELAEHLQTQQVCTLKTRDLSKEALFIDDQWVSARGLSDVDRTEDDQTALALSNTLIKELRETDIILAGIPIYNFNVPASFKAWLDLVVRARETFRYTAEGPVGLLPDKHFVAVIASGGTKLGADNDFATPYLRFITQFIGIDNLTLIDATGGGRARDDIVHAARTQFETLDFVSQ